MADVDTLIRDLRRGNYYSRSTAARALGEIGGEKAAVALIEALNDEDDWVKEYAAESLGKLAFRPAVQAIGGLLKSQNYKVRSVAAEALGRIGGGEARMLLDPLRKDRDSWVREAAINALERMPEEKSQSHPEPSVQTSSLPESESDMVLTISEDAAEPKEKSIAVSPSLPGRSIRTPEEIVQLLTANTNIKYKSTQSGFLLRVPVGGGRHQRVRLKFDSTDDDGSPIIQVFAIVGPASPKNYDWALKLNPGFSYGAIGLVKIDGKELFAVTDTLLEENVDVRALQKSVLNLARQGDKLERKLIQKDLW